MNTNRDSSWTQLDSPFAPPGLHLFLSLLLFDGAGDALLSSPPPIATSTPCSDSFWFLFFRVSEICHRWPLFWFFFSLFIGLFGVVCWIFWLILFFFGFLVCGLEQKNVSFVACLCKVDVNHVAMCRSV